MNKPDESWRIPFALFLMAIMAVFIISTMQPNLCHLPIVPVESDGCLEFWLNRYQTLIAGTFALGAAWVAWRAAQGQMLHSEEMEERRRDNENYAARAVLALALEGVTEYLEGVLNELKRGISTPGLIPRSDSFPPPPIAAIAPIRECVRFAPPAQRKQIAHLLALFQIQQARLKGITRPIVFSHAMQMDCAVDAARLYAVAQDLFQYARRSEEGALPRPSPEDVRKVLSLMGFHPETFEQLHKWVR